MKQNTKNLQIEGELQVDKRDFTLCTLEDEIRVDNLFKELLMRFYCESMEGGLSPEEATALVSGADYYIRDFLVGIKRASIFDEKPGLVRQFAGNWYIVNTLEPNMAELKRLLSGTREFYRYLNGKGLISARHVRQIDGECADLAFYEERIESFWAITGDGYFQWERECSLKDEPHRP